MTKIQGCRSFYIYIKVEFLLYFYFYICPLVSMCCAFVIELNILNAMFWKYNQITRKPTRSPDQHHT